MAVNLRMTSDEFIDWSMRQPEGGRFELLDGEVLDMASERWLHAKVKGRVSRRLAEAVEAARLQCDVVPEGMAVSIRPTTVFEPDVAVRCGKPLGNDVTSYDDPMVVVEVASPSTRTVDTSFKLDGYFSLPSMRHYLIVCPEPQTIVHHQRHDDGSITVTLPKSGSFRLDPPGITLDVASLFPPGAA